MSHLRLLLKKPTGIWSSKYANLARHNCQVPGMPTGSPHGLIWTCECGVKWYWRPMYRHVWSRSPERAS